MNNYLTVIIIITEDLSKIATISIPMTEIATKFTFKCIYKDKTHLKMGRSFTTLFCSS